MKNWLLSNKTESVFLLNDNHNFKFLSNETVVLPIALESVLHEYLNFFCIEIVIKEGKTLWFLILVQYGQPHPSLPRHKMKVSKKFLAERNCFCLNLIHIILSYRPKYALVQSDCRILWSSVSLEGTSHVLYFWHGDSCQRKELL